MALALAVVVVEAAVYRDGRYLMIVRGEGEDHAAGLLSFPGGGIEFAEAPDILELTAAREVQEETGVTVESLEYVESHAFPAHDGTPVVIVTFLGRHAAGVPTIADPGEVAALRWMSAAEILGDPACSEWLAPIVERVERARERLGWPAGGDAGALTV